MTVGAILGAGQAVAGHIGAVQTATAENKNKARLFAQRQSDLYADHYSNINEYYLRGVDAQIQWDTNTLDYNRFVAKQQYEVNKTIEAAFRAMESDYTTMSKSSKLAAAATRSGNTAKRIRTAVKAEYGRKVAGESAKIDRARENFLQEIKRMHSLKTASDIKARTMIGMEPIRGAEPLEPTWSKGPGMFSLLTNVAMGVTAGRMAGYGAKSAEWQQANPFKWI